jgi:primase-polymerase (primpol)-like protein
VDLDDCRDPETGTGANWATAIIDQLDSYTEVSPSGTGYHVLIDGELPDGRNRKGDVELYESARFFTVTGEHVSGTPDQINTRSEALAAVHDEYVDEDEMTSQTEPSVSAGDAQSEPVTDVDLSDEEFLEKARSAANGAKVQPTLEWRHERVSEPL